MAMLMDSGLYSFIVFLLGFWITVNALYEYRRSWFERHGFKLYYGVVLVYKRRTMLRNPGRPVRGVTYAWLALFAYSLVLFYYAMYLSILSRLGLYSENARATVIVPGLTLTGMPLVYFAVAVVIAAAVHELFHAFTAVIHGVPVKGLGFALVAIVPLAFTEIDEEGFKKARLRSRLVVLAAGPASNIILALLLVPVLSAVMSPTTLAVIDVVHGSLAEHYGIKPYSLILSINGTPATLENLREVFSVNETVNISMEIMEPDGSIRNITVTKPWNTTRLGVYIVSAPKPSLAQRYGVALMIHLSGLLQYSFLVNYSLALINAAPLFITDGGRIVYEWIKKTPAHILNTVTLIITILALTPLLG